MSKNILNDASNKFWFSRGQFITDAGAGIDANECRELSNTAFLAGARWAMRESARLNPYVSQFLEMCILLGGPDETETTSAYWRDQGDDATRREASGVGTTSDQIQPPY